MKTIVALTLALPLTLGCAAAERPFDDDAESSAVEGARVKVFVTNVAPRPVVLFSKALGAVVSGGLSTGDTATFDPIAIGAYRLNDDQGRAIPGTDFIITENDGDARFICDAERCAKEDRPLVDDGPEPAPADALPEGERYDVYLEHRGSGGEVLFLHRPGEGYGKTEANQRQRHGVVAGSVVELEIYAWDGQSHQVVRDAFGRTRAPFTIPRDPRFRDGSLSCWLAARSALACTMRSPDGKLIARADGRIFVRP